MDCTVNSTDVMQNVLESATGARRPLTHARALLAEAPDVLANAKHTTATDDFEAHKNQK